MTFQAKSRAQQWMLWLGGALVAFLAYVLVTQGVLGHVSFDLFDPRAYRIALPVIAVFSLFAWETRWDGVRRTREVEKRGGISPEGVARAAKQALPVCGQRTAISDSAAQSKGGAQTVDAAACRVRKEVSAFDLTRRAAASTEESAHHCPPQPSASTSSLAGEALYAKAQRIPHQEIPDYETDGLYLDLVGDAAVAGYAPAMAKLGEYAMRRGTWVEAYYWTWRARKGGEVGLVPVLREIRQRWMLEGAPDESENVYELFSEEAGSVGRALLSIDTGSDTYAAKAFLKQHYPEFLSA